MSRFGRKAFMFREAKALIEEAERNGREKNMLSLDIAVGDVSTVGAKVEDDWNFRDSPLSKTTDVQTSLCRQFSAA